MRKALLSLTMFVLAGGLFAPPPVQADVKVFACEPEWAALAREVGGGKIDAFSATHAGQDPHHIRARPSLIAKIRRTDLLICSGAGLEIGWLPLLLQRGAPAGVQPGKPGHLMATDHIEVLERSTVTDRSLGDVHPEGNPHTHLDPRNLIRLVAILQQRLATLDGVNAEYYRDRAASFTKNFARLLAEWERRSMALKEMPVIVHHKSWSYLMQWLGLREVASLELKPGIPPTPSHLGTLLQIVRSRPVKAILLTPYDPTGPADWLHGKTGIPIITLPYTVSRDAAPGSLARLFEETLIQLERANGAR